MNLEDQILSSVGEMHSAQDGLTVGVLAVLIATKSPLLPLVAVGLGLGAKRLSRRALARQIPDLVRAGHIRKSPEYFVVGVFGGALVAGVASVSLDALGVSAGGLA